jgi:hypothetical protein
MKTIIYLIVTSFLSTGMYEAALNSSNPAPGILCAIAFWAWFLWGWDRRRKKTALQRQQQR